MLLVLDETVRPDQFIVLPLQLNLGYQQLVQFILSIIF